MSVKSSDFFILFFVVVYLFNRSRIGMLHLLLGCSRCIQARILPCRECHGRTWHGWKSRHSFCSSSRRSCPWLAAPSTSQIRILEQQMRFPLLALHWAFGSAHRLWPYQRCTRRHHPSWEVHRYFHHLGNWFQVHLSSHQQWCWTKYRSLRSSDQVLWERIGLLHLHLRRQPIRGRTRFFFPTWSTVSIHKRA